MTDTATDDLDLRARRTREALFAAFFALVLEQRYDSIRLGDVLERAGVGRSTFYAHFRNKDALLIESLKAPLAALADIVIASDVPPALPAVLAHFAEHRTLVLSLLRGSGRRHAETALIRLIDQRWSAAGLARDCPVPLALAAGQLAQALLAPVQAWLQTPSGIDVTRLASVLHRSVRGLVGGLCDRRL